MKTSNVLWHNTINKVCATPKNISPVFGICMYFGTLTIKRNLDHLVEVYI